MVRLSMVEQRTWNPTTTRILWCGERKYNKAGDKFVDETNGFSFDLPAVSYKYTAVPDVTPEQGVFDEAGFNEEGVSISATVSASANDDIQK